MSTKTVRCTVGLGMFRASIEGMLVVCLLGGGWLSMEVRGGGTWGKVCGPRNHVCSVSLHLRRTANKRKHCWLIENSVCLMSLGVTRNHFHARSSKICCFEFQNCQLAKLDISPVETTSAFLRSGCVTETMIAETTLMN